MAKSAFRYSVQYTSSKLPYNVPSLAGVVERQGKEEDGGKWAVSGVGREGGRGRRKKGRRGRSGGGG